MTRRNRTLTETASLELRRMHSSVLVVTRSLWVSLLVMTAIPQWAEAAPQPANSISLELTPAGMHLSIDNMTLKGVLRALSTKADFEIIGIETVAEKPIQRATLRGKPEEVFARLLRGYSYIVNYRETGGRKAAPNRLNVERLIVLGPGGVMPADGNYNMDTMAKTSQQPDVVQNKQSVTNRQRVEASRGAQATISSRPGPVAGLLTKQAALQTLPVPSTSKPAGTAGANAAGNTAAAPVTTTGWKPGPEDMANLAKLTRTAMQGTEALVKGLEVAQRSHLEAQQK